MPDKDIEELRDRIDELDKKIIDLLSERVDIAGDILDKKEETGREIKDRAREQEIIEKASDIAKENGLNPDFAKDLMRIIISRTVGTEREMAGEPGVWAKVHDFFSENPAQLKIARVLYKYGFGVRENGDVVAGDIRIPAVQIAKEADVDRRAVNSTAKTILENEELKELFANLRPVPYLKGVARQMGMGLIEIIPTDATQSGIISEVTNVLSNHEVNIRQSITDDPYFTTQPKLTIITDDLVGGDIIDELRELPSVDKVIIY